MSDKLKNVLETYKFYRDLRDYVHRLINHNKSKKYNRRVESILNNIKSKETINIVFFIHSLSYWKYDGLVKLLKDNPRFKFVLVPFINPSQDKTLSLNFIEQIQKYCIKNDLPIYNSYNFETGQYDDLSFLSPDVVIYTHPYNVGYKKLLIDEFKDKCVFFYTPYGVSLTKGSYFYDTYLTNVAYRIFVGSELEKIEFKKYFKSSNDKYVTTGFTIFDDIENAKESNVIWPDDNKKRIIWAPHHSIDARLSFASSNFERLCDDMLSIAKKYSDNINISLKPHPLLMTRLYQKWGKDRTTQYFDEWNKLDNTFICNGNYSELFAQSDALIHDCASFACEYLLTEKPAFYICKGDKPNAGIDNDFGLRCFEQHYHGYSVDDIEAFIENIIKGTDSLRDARIEFVRKYLLPPDGKSVAENMMFNLLDIFKK